MPKPTDPKQVRREREKEIERLRAKLRADPTDHDTRFAIAHLRSRLDG